jgi:hypothetical protein
MDRACRNMSTFMAVWKILVGTHVLIMMKSLFKMQRYGRFCPHPTLAVYTRKVATEHLNCVAKEVFHRDLFP